MPTATANAKKLRKTSKVEIKAATVLPVVETPAPAEDSTNNEGQIVFADEEQSSEPEDDQTAALLKGFESSDDEDEVDVNPGEITEIPSIPDSLALQSKLSAAAASKDSGQPGVIYVGRIPHGFYEHQMRAYFSQFGEISRLRLSRNRRTGASRHFAFLEFASSEVAGIVADTMDNYLMFGHLLKVKLVSNDQVHKELFKGAGTRFKKVPWNRIERFRLQRADRDGWEKRVKHEEQRRVSKAQKLKEMGYEFEAPKLKEVGEVPVQALEGAKSGDVEDVPLPVSAPKDEIALLKSQLESSQPDIEHAAVIASIKTPHVPASRPAKKIASATEDTEQLESSVSEKLSKGSKKTGKRAAKTNKGR